ncbi:MAG: helix-turn-helix transcriptional regulator [Nannocystaceae bacterium]
MSELDEEARERLQTELREELRARVAKRIRELAQARRLPLTHLADEAGVSRAHLWTVLGGKNAASIDFLAKLAVVLGVDPDELVKRYRKPRSRGG